MASVCRWLIWVHKPPALLLPLLLEGKECWWLCSLGDAASQSISGVREKVSVGCPTEVTASPTLRPAPSHSPGDTGQQRGKPLYKPLWHRSGLSCPWCSAATRGMSAERGGGGSALRSCSLHW